jgi:outer membrane protein OmpA-like peptidoglycan-associated protein/WD40 repeat protein
MRDFNEMEDMKHQRPLGTGSPSVFQLSIWRTACFCMAVTAFVAQSAQAAPKWDFSNHKTNDPARLYQLAYESDSPAEKLRIRSWLAATQGDSAEGLFARAWMADYSGDGKAALSLYQQCVARFPKFDGCLVNGLNAENSMGDSLRDKPVLKAALALGPTELDPDTNETLIRNVNAHLIDVQKDRGAAASYIAKFRQRYPKSWVLDFVEGSNEWGRDDSKALGHYRSAIENAGSKASGDLYKAVIRLETGSLYDSKRGSRIDVASRRLVEFYRRTQKFESDGLALFFVTTYVQGQASKNTAIKQITGLGVVPSLELLEQIGVEITRDAPAWYAQLRQQQSAQAQLDPVLNKWLAYNSVWGEDKTEEGVRQYRLAVDGAYSEKQRAELASDAVWELRKRGDCKTAEREAVEMLSRHAGLGQSTQFHSNRFEAQLCMGDLVGARASLNRQTSLGRSPESNANDEARLVLLEVEKAESLKAGANRFVRDWQAGTDGKLTLQIEFATGSAQIPPRYDATLKQVADALKQPGAADYVFEVAGHTDSTGNAQQNLQLSQKRAQAIVDQLVQRHGLRTLKLRANGFGPSFPVADNQTELGRQRNRRVEITPISSAASPSIARVGAPVSIKKLSNDGRLMVDGRSVLWDTRQWIALHQLPTAKKVEFTRDGRYLVGASSPSTTTLDSSIWVYELASKQVIARLLFVPGDTVHHFSIAPDGKRLAIVNAGVLETYSMPKLERQVSAIISPTRSSGPVAWVGNDKIAATVRYSGEILKLFNSANLKVEKTFSEADYTHSVGVSASGKYLVATPNSGQLMVWDTATWQKREIPREQWGRYSDEYVFHPIREQMIADQWNGDKRTTVLVDLNNLQVSKPIASGSAGVFEPNGETAFVNQGWAPDRINLQTLEKLPQPFAPEVGFLAYQKVVGEDLLRTSLDDDKTQLWDLATARPIHKLQHPFGDPVFGAIHQTWFKGKDNSVNVLDAQSFERRADGIVPKAFDDSEWSSKLTTNRWLFVRKLAEQVDGKTRHRQGELVILDRQSGKELGRHRFDLATEDFRYGRDPFPYSAGFTLAVSSEGRYAAVSTGWKEYWGSAWVDSKVIHIVDLQTGQRIKRLEMSKEVIRIDFRPEQAGVLLVHSKDYVYRYKIASDSFASGFQAASTDLVMYDDGKQHYSYNPFYVTALTAEGQARFLPAFGSTSADVVPGRNLLLLNFGYEELRYYDLKTLSHQLSLLRNSKGGWVAYTPDGFYSASAGGTKGLYWALGEATLPFSALKEKFERPDVVRERLESIFKGTAGAVHEVQVVNSGAANAGDGVPNAPDRPVASVTPASGTSPAATVNSAAQLDANFFDPPFKLRVVDPPKSVSEAALSLKVGITKTRATDMEPAIELNVNGQQIEARGLARLDLQGASCGDGSTFKLGCETVRSLPLSLEEGRNVVVVNAFFKGGRAQPEVVSIERKKAVTQGPLPRLWFFGVGVSDYSDPQNNLKFAHRDAQALAAAFQKQEGKLFAKVNTKLLVNKEADARTVKSEMNRFLRQASSQDLIIIFLAGHGMQDNDQTLYYMTADSNLNEPFTGIGVSELHDFLRRRPMAQKALLLLDICHAGAAAGGQGRRGVPSGDDVINQLVNGTGVKVLASSQGKEYSLEQPDFRGGHGAFTAALLEGLEGKAGQGGHVSVLQLERYVSQRVPELTKGRQHPTAPDSNNFQDYPLAVQ